MANILVVNDDESTSETVRDILSKHQHKPVIARNLESALAAVAESAPDMILCAMLSLQCGYELIEKVQKNPATMSIPFEFCYLNRLRTPFILNSSPEAFSPDDLIELIDDRLRRSAMPIQTAEEHQHIGRKILVIDNDLHFCQAIRDLLEFDKFEVIQAFNGRAGIDLARIHKPDLIISDLMMPHLSGVEVYHELKEDNEFSTPFILMTARILMKDDIPDNLEVLFKPFDSESLLKTVHTALQVYSASS